MLLVSKLVIISLLISRAKHAFNSVVEFRGHIRTNSSSTAAREFSIKIATEHKACKGRLRSLCCFNLYVS